MKKKKVEKKRKKKSWSVRVNTSWLDRTSQRCRRQIDSFGDFSLLLLLLLLFGMQKTMQILLTALRYSFVSFSQLRITTVQTQHIWMEEKVIFSFSFFFAFHFFLSMIAARNQAHISSSCVNFIFDKYTLSNDFHFIRREMLTSKKCFCSDA